MGEPLPSQPKKFNTELTDYSVMHNDTTGPYADNLDIDALVVGAGFGTMQQYFLIYVLRRTNMHPPLA
jgi:hypothetical protein